METTTYTELGEGITCIDAQYTKSGVACFYLLEHQGECAIIETGTSHSVPYLEQLLQGKGISVDQVRYVIPTHVHLDHAGGAGLMMRRFPEAQLIVHPKGARHLADPARLVASAKTVYGEETFNRQFGEVIAVDEARIRAVEDGVTLKLGERVLAFRHTKGHADHHFCVWDETSRGWFSGDMFGISYADMHFPDGDFVMPTTTPTQFRPEEYLKSVQLLGSYSPQGMYLTHFGRVNYTSAVSEQLSSQIIAYRELALEFGELGDQLREELMHMTLDNLSRLNPPGGVENYRQALEMDVNLNAQGIEVWAQRVANGSL
ncbi:MAG: MBL fold metallo-hydrolase [Halieaceae bacterium]|nr:MBL fold metallo-hydrolase [Halieaceae bacterium]